MDEVVVFGELVPVDVEDVGAGEYHHLAATVEGLDVEETGVPKVDELDLQCPVRIVVEAIHTVLAATVTSIEEGARQLPICFPWGEGPNAQGIVLLCGDVGSLCSGMAGGSRKVAMDDRQGRRWFLEAGD